MEQFPVRREQITAVLEFAARSLAKARPGHTIEEARARGWDALGNGALLDAAESAGFDVLVTTDRNLPYQQNLSGRRIAVVILGKARWKLIKVDLPAIAVVKQCHHRHCKKT